MKHQDASYIYVYMLEHMYYHCWLKYRGPFLWSALYFINLRYALSNLFCLVVKNFYRHC